MTEPARLRELLGAASAPFGIDDSSHVGTIWRHWSEIVGAAIAAHAEPTSLRNGVLRVRTNASTWATEISYLADEIAEKANRKVGAEVVREVRVWTSPEAISARADAPSPGPAEVAEEPSARPPTDDPQSALGAAYAAWRKRWSQARSGTRQKR